MKPEEKADLVTHLEELRTRLIRAVLYLVAGTSGAWFCYHRLYDILLSPVLPALQRAGGNIITSTWMEGFLAQFQVSLIGGVTVAVPLLLWELWGFVAPGLTDTERRAARVVLPLSVLLFASGVALCFLLAPRAVVWMMSFNPPGAVPLFQLQKQVSLMAKLCLAFGLCFQLPLVVAFLVKVGIVGPQTLRAKRREAIVLIFLVAAVVTPTWDPLTMTILALPIVFLYEGTVWWAVLSERKARRAEQRALLDGD